MINSLAKSLSKEFEFEDEEKLKKALIKAFDTLYGDKSWKEVNYGTDKLDQAQKQLSIAGKSLGKAYHFFSGDREFLRMAKLETAVVDDVEEIPIFLKKLKKIYLISEKAHFKDSRGRRGLERGKIEAFQILAYFWVKECGRPLKDYFKEEGNLGRTEPGNEGVRFMSSALKGLDEKITNSEIRTLFQNYLTY